MAFHDLSRGGKVVKKVRDKTTNKSLATTVARRMTTLIEKVSSLKISRSSTTPNSQIAITSQLDEVVADFNNAIENDPPEGNTYDLVGHVQTSRALKRTYSRLDTIEAQVEQQLQRQQTTSSQTVQVTSPTSIGDSNAMQESPTVTAPPVAPTAAPTATGTQRLPPRRQGSIPPPRRRDSQPPATPKDVDMISGLDPITESATKDDNRIIRRLIKLMEELNKTVQAAERDFDLGHNAQGGTIRLPDISHDPRIHQAVRELLEGPNSAQLRKFQETSVKMNQIITEVRGQLNLPKTCRIQLYQLDDPRGHNLVCVLPDNTETTDELITHLVEENLFEDEGDVRIFLRKNQAHQLTPKGTLWDLAEGTLNLRFPGPTMDAVQCEEGAFVLDWVVNDKEFAIALMDNGIEETGSVLDIPKFSKKTNKCVREHLQTSLTKELSGYEIDCIQDIKKPNDDTVADKLFNRNNFKPTKHSLVIKLRTKV